MRGFRIVCSVFGAVLLVVHSQESLVINGETIYDSGSGEDPSGGAAEATSSWEDNPAAQGFDMDAAGGDDGNMDEEEGNAPHPGDDDDDGEEAADGEEDEDDEADDSDEEASDEEGVWQQGSLTSEQIRALYSKIDANNDHKVSKDEIVAFAKLSQHSSAEKEAGLAFEEADVDKDGKVSADELLEHKFGVADPGDIQMPTQSDEEKAEAAQLKLDKALEKDKFKLADKDGSGFLDKKELQHVLHPETHEKVLHLTSSANLKAKDKDGDGQLSHAEMWETEESEETDPDTVAELMRDFENLDSDKNGKLNVEELKLYDSGHYHYDDAMTHLFEIVDEDLDHFISLDELESAQESLANTAASSHFLEWAEQYEL